jgi:hypothetical protein
MHRNKYGQSQCRVGVTIGKLALITLVALTATFLSPPVQAKDKLPEETSQVYQHTYDEVFQASQDAIERLGCFVTAADKGSGTITGGGKCATYHACPGASLKVDFQMKIETVSAKPETRVSVDAKTKGEFGAYACVGGARKNFKDLLLNEVQKVLSTYH